ncbi:MAG: SDR family NAD(P)-dependent oxidoreductase [Pseudomonadota bacterium]
MRVAITGARRGIGRALADAYGARGDQVMALTRAELDVADQGSIAAWGAGLAAPIDLLVCNAGILEDRGEALADGYPADMWARGFAVNVTGVFLTVQAALPMLRAAGAGKVAIISSQMGSSTRAKGNTMIYRVTKAAALNLGMNLAEALRPEGIAVGIYHPGWVRTDMGGGEADISVEASRDGLMARFEALGIGNTGCFETWDGRAHPI